MKTDGYSVKKTAELLNIAERTVIDWIHKGKLLAKKDGKSWRIVDDLTNGNGAAKHGNDAALIEWLKEQNEELQTQNAELLRQMEENQKRSDTIILQLTRQLESKQKQIEDLRERSLWRRFKIALGFG